MSAAPSFRNTLVKTFLYPLLSLFLVPLLAYVFVQHALPELDREITAAIERDIDSESRVSAAEREREKAFIRATPPSHTCGSNDPGLAKYREAVCSHDLDLWQFHIAGRASFWLLAGGVLVLLAVLGLGAAAFRDRRAQYVSFVLGWRLLTAVAVVEVVAQGALAVWLSYWVTVFYDHHYYPKIILLIGLVVAGAAFLVVKGLFRRPPRNMAVEGELVGQDDAPALWAHVRDYAARLDTRAPDHIVAGIDANFFVTESPMTMGEKTIQGRSLFISIPLLRQLDRTEADAVLAHELAHFSGGDTEDSARLGPKLAQYDHYCAMMNQGVNKLVFHLLNLYRVIFEFALKRDSRAREFLADRSAAQLASPQAIAHSLVKIAAYANYRGEIEHKLFEQTEQHGENIGIAQRIALGLNAYAESARFIDDMHAGDVPHPFDTHPPLAERMANVGYRVEEQEYGRIAAAAPASSWTDDIRTAAEIEQRLWASYEQEFAAQHEQTLAWRYEPANDAELAVVLKYFPPVNFSLKRDKRLEVSHAGLLLPGTSETLSWDRVAGLKYEDGYFGDVMQITHPEKGMLGKKTTKVKLPGASRQRASIKQTLGVYWQRHQYMRKNQGE